MPVWSNLRDRWETHEGAYYFAPKKAQRALDFFPELLTHHIGDFAGDPFELRADQDLLIVRPAFGWRRTSDGMRRFRKVFVFAPKGWGKSPLGAGLGLYLAWADNEAAAEVYAVAGDREQARIVHENAKVMVENSPKLNEGCEIIKNAITWPELHSAYTVLSSDASTKHGFRPHGIIFDELHGQGNRNLFEALRKSMAKRMQPMMIIITHAGVDDTSICYEEYELAKSVLAGRTDVESTLPVMFEAKPEEDWTDPAIWKRVNPGHGITVQHDQVVEECNEARAEPRKQNDFKRFHLNIWTGQASAWIPVEWWDNCKGELPSDDELMKYQIAGGLDMAQKIDLAAFAQMWKLPLLRDVEPESVEVVAVETSGEKPVIVKKNVTLNYRVVAKVTFWLPEDTLEEHVKNDGVQYDIWRDEGLLEVTEGGVIDHDAIVDYVLGLKNKFKYLKQGEIGYDPSFATTIATDLERKGLKPVEVLQNYSHLSEACQIFEALVKSKRLLHDGNALLRWNVENVAIKTDDARRIRPVKPQRTSKRIDGVVAMIMALSRLMVMPELKKRGTGLMIV